MLKKTVLALMALMLVVAFQVWGAGSSSRTTQTTQPSKRNLGGMHVLIGTWGNSNYNPFTDTPGTEGGIRTLAWRKSMMEEYNFTMELKSLGPVGDIQQLAIASIMAGDPAASVFTFQTNWVLPMVRQGLLYPISDNTVVDFRNPKPAQDSVLATEWSGSTVDTFTFNGKGYAASIGMDTGACEILWFNKRLFREAGLDPDLPYNMQKDGTWTWDNFLDICRRLTRDTNNDGIIDVYALADSRILDYFLGPLALSNGASYIDKDSTGRFVLGATRPEFLEALQFYLRLQNEGYIQPMPQGVAWTYGIDQFTLGNVAMLGCELWIRADVDNNMQDDWGIVFFPKGPRASNYRVYSRDNVYVVPATFNAAQVDNILFAMDLWYSRLPENVAASVPPYGWYRDSRSVDETLAMIQNLAYRVFKSELLIPGFNRSNLVDSLSAQDYRGADPVQLVERFAPTWNALIRDVNAELFPNR